MSEHYYSSGSDNQRPHNSPNAADLKLIKVSIPVIPNSGLLFSALAGLNRYPRLFSKREEKPDKPPRRPKIHWDRKSADTTIFDMRRPKRRPPKKT